MVAPPLTVRRAKRLRRQLSLPEGLLWKALRANAIGARVRRQHPIGPYILDFFCADARLAIEVDGSSHTYEARIAHDERRDDWLAKQGVRVLRVPARLVLSDMDATLATIAEAMKQGQNG